MSRILPFPKGEAVPSVTQPADAELFPFASPETLLAYLRRAEARILDVAPELTEQECCRLHGELALVDLALSKMAERIHRSPSYLNRHALPDVRPLVRELPGLAGSAT